MNVLLVLIGLHWLVPITSQSVELFKLIKQFLPANHLSAIRSGISHFSCITRKCIHTIHGYYAAKLRKTVPLLNMHTAWNVSKYGVFCGPHFPVFGPNAERDEVSLRIQYACGKIRAKKNSLFGHFLRSGTINCKILLKSTPNW